MSYAFYLNPRAAGGKARVLWEHRRFTGIREYLGTPTATYSGLSIGDSQESYAAHTLFWVQDCLKSGIKKFISAGGDGTHHTLINAIMQAAQIFGIDINEISLGAIGLGSSNDFLKRDRIQYLGCVDFASAAVAPIGQITCGDGLQRYFAINASLGLTAEVNRYFNERPPWLRRLSQLTINTSIVVSTLQTLRRYHDIDVEIAANEFFASCQLTNAAIVLKRSFGGGFAYDRDSLAGKFGCYLSLNLSRLRILKTFASLGTGKFPRSSGHHFFETETVEFHGSPNLTIECDGETFRARDVTFNVVQGPRICPLMS